MSIPPAVSSDSFRLDPEPCNLCKVTLRDILEPRYPGWAPRYHSSYSELEKSAQDGCNFCRMIRHAIHVWSYGLQNGESQMAKIETIRLKVQPQSRRPYEIVGQKPLCFRISTGQRETDLAGSPEINMRYSWNPRSIRERYQPMSECTPSWLFDRGLLLTKGEGNRSRAKYRCSDSSDPKMDKRL